LGKGKILIGALHGDTLEAMSKNNQEPGFEEALDKLEKLVSSMESGDIPLAELVEKFEEGSKLVKICEDRLKKAELRIQKLRQKEDSIELDEFEPVQD